MTEVANRSRTHPETVVSLVGTFLDLVFRCFLTAGHGGFRSWLCRRQPL